MALSLRKRYKIISPAPNPVLYEGADAWNFNFSLLGDDIESIELNKADLVHFHSAADLTSGTISTARLPTGIDAANLANGTVSNAEFQYLNGVTSAIQTQLDAKQPLDSDLTSIAALTTTSFGRGLLTLADATAGRTAFGLGTAAVVADSALAHLAGSETFTGQKTFETGAAGASPVIFRQTGGVAGTDEIQISHDGTNGLIESKDGVLELKVSSMLSGYPRVQITSRGGGGQPCISATAGTGSGRLCLEGILNAPGATGGWQVDATTANISPTTSTYQVTWGGDVGLVRDAAGVLRITNASTGYGGLRALNVAIGTTSTPSAKLVVDNSGNNRAGFSATAISAEASGDTSGQYATYYRNQSAAVIMTTRADRRVGITIDDPDANLHVVATAIGTPVLIAQGISGQTADILQLNGISSTSTRRQQLAIKTVAVDNTDATRKYRAIFNIYDTAAREALRLEANGSEAIVSLVGSVRSIAIGTVSLIVRAISSQTASLQVWQNSSSTTLLQVTQNGYITTPNGNDSSAGNASAALSMTLIAGTGGSGLGGGLAVDKAGGDAGNIILTAGTGGDGVGEDTGDADGGIGGSIYLQAGRGGTPAGGGGTGDGEVVVNNSSLPLNFRVSGDTDPYALFVYGSNNRVGIGDSNPGGKLSISTGTITSTLPALNIASTWNSGGVTFTGIKSNITDTTSATASLLLDLQVGGSSKFNVAKSGQTTCAAAFSSGVVALTDAATITVDASLGNHFRVTLGGNRTLGNPSNAVNGQRLVFEIIQPGSGGPYTITLDTKYALGTDITAVTLTTTASKRDFLTVVYNSTADKFYVVGFSRGY